MKRTPDSSSVGVGGDGVVDRGWTYMVVTRTPDRMRRVPSMTVTVTSDELSLS